ncbi:MAG: N-methyl-L-tryptophan oxidase [Vulcanimicrobiaceae bacterium]
MVYDIAVVGLGAMGSATAARAALSGAKVIGIEQFGPAHGLGASGGKSRIIRQAYFEDAAYVPLLLRAYELWRDLEVRTQKSILRTTGLLMVGTEQSAVISGSLRSANQHGLAIEQWSAAQINRRFRTLKVLPDEVGVYEREGGFVIPEEAIRAHVALAAESGADLRFEIRVSQWGASSNEVQLTLSDGSTVRARKLVLAMGPWFEEILKALGVPIRVQRNVMAWFEPKIDAYDVDRFPCFLLDRAGMPALLYGFPDAGDGVKAAFHGYGEYTHAESLERTVAHSRDIHPLADALERWMPGAAGSYREGKACMYTLTPDEHFVIDRHPQLENVVLCGGFSGHGFKFASVVGEIASDLALSGATRYDVDFLRLKRFTAES